MRLGLNLGYWGAGNDAANLQLAREAESLGFSVVWAAEAYGSDAATVLAWVAAQTSRIDVGSAVFQIPARAPTMTAMTAATLDTLSGGRFRLGLGVSGPQVSEGWYGVRFDAPLARTREYLAVVDAALARNRVTFQGRHWQLPLPDGPGKALHLTVHPVRERIPRYLGAVGPQNLRLTGETCDGWLGLFPSVRTLPAALAEVRSGRERAGRGLAGFDVAPTVPLVVGEDVERCADAVRPWAALYLGGMGSRKRNFYHDLAASMGYPAEADAVQEAYLDRRHADAAAAVPLAFLDETALLGGEQRIAERLAGYAAAGVTTLNVSVPYPADAEVHRAALRTVAAALDRSGIGT